MSFPKYPAYKDSGVEWLGEVPEHWSVTAIKRVCAVVGGSTPKSDQEAYWDGDITWVTPADLSRLTGFEIHDSMRTITAEGLESCGTTMVPEGSVILSTRAPIGSLGIAAKALCTNQGCKALVPNGPNSRLLAYLLTASNEALNVRGKGTTFLELSGDELGAFVVPLASVPEQTAIASFLDHETAKIDALVAEQEKLITLLQEKRQAVISHAVTKGLNPNAPMKDSGVEWLGEVPAHWEVAHLKRRCTLITDGAHISPETEGGAHFFVSTKDISDDGIDFDGALRTSPTSYAYMVKTGCQPIDGDVLFSKDGTIGRTVVVRGNAEFVVASSLIIIRPQADTLIPEFLNALCQSWVVRQQVDGFVKGAGLPRLSIQNLLKIIGVFPPIQEQRDIVAYLAMHELKSSALAQEAESIIQLLQERRTALISAAVTGQIDVRNWSPQEGV